MNRKTVLFALAGIIPFCTFAQETRAGKFALVGGYEHFPEQRKGNGYNVGIEYDRYLWKNIYAVMNFHAGVNDGQTSTSYIRDNVSYNFNLSNSVRDYMLGVGLGYDFLHRKRHTMYLQGTVGLGSSEEQKDYITISPGAGYDMVDTQIDKSTRFAISVSAGYDYQLTKLVSIGINYTGWQIGYEYKNSANLKLGLSF